MKKSNMNEDELWYETERWSFVILLSFIMLGLEPNNKKGKEDKLIIEKNIYENEEKATIASTLFRFFSKIYSREKEVINNTDLNDEFDYVYGSKKLINKQ